MKKILFFITVLLSIILLPLASHAEWTINPSLTDVTGIVISSITYVSDADTVKITINYTRPTAGVDVPEGFTIHYVGELPGGDTVGDTPSFGPLEFEVSDTPHVANYSITGLLPEKEYSISIGDAADSVASIYATGTVVTTSSDGVFVDPTITTEEVTETPYDDSYYVLLAPLPISGTNEPTTAVSTGSVGPDRFDFGDYMNGLLTFAIGIAGALAVVMIVIGGIQYMSTDNFGEKMEGKGHITNAVGGMILLIGAYMLLNTLNPNLVNFNFKVKSVEIDADPIFVLEHNDTNTSPVGGKECNGKYTVGQEWFPDIPPRKSATENILTSVTNVTINHNNCSVVSDTAPGGSSCTSVYKLKTDAVAKIRSKCPTCEIIITGGTECWLHSYTTAHGPDSEVVDLRNGASVPNLNKYIKGEGNKNFKGNISGWGDLYVIDDIEVVDEGDHYHIISSTGQGKATGKLKY